MKQKFITTQDIPTATPIKTRRLIDTIISINVNPFLFFIYHHHTIVKLYQILSHLNIVNNKL